LSIVSSTTNTQVEVENSDEDATKVAVVAKDDRTPCDRTLTKCHNRREITVYHFTNNHSSRKSSGCSLVEGGSRKTIESSSSWDENQSISSYCVEVQGDGHSSTPGLADCGAPENEVLLELLRRQLALNGHRNTQGDENLALHVDSLNALISRIVNAKPPSGHLYYFAYGPDINTERFASYIKRRHDDTTWALLYGFKMTCFSVKSSPHTWPKIEYSPQNAVEGRLYVVTRQEAVLLDNQLGNTLSFLSILLPVWLLELDGDGTSDCSTSEYCLPALVHVPPNLLLD
jgi:hypothetical protein